MVCHVWPGITPWSVWDLQMRVWRTFQQSADEWVRARSEGSDG